MDGRKLVKIEHNTPYLDVVWQVSNFCNYKCSYCNPGNYCGDSRNDDNLITYITNLEAITKKYLDLGYENFKFFFSGGEPTLWRNLIPIIEWARENLPNVVIAVNTNFSRPLSWWKRNHHLFDDVVASFHVEYADKDKYLENAKFLCDKLNYFSCKMLMHEERFWEVAEFGNLLKEELPNYFIEWTPLFDEMSKNAGPWEYKDSGKAQFLKEHSVDQQFTIPKPHLEKPFYSEMYWDDGTKTGAYSNEIILERQNFFKDWECSIGDSIWIDQIGQVSMGTCGQVKVLGNILWDTLDIGPKKIICKKDHCHCGTDILIPKKKVIKIKKVKE
jgi:organic radical activating enzyme